MKSILSSEKGKSAIATEGLRIDCKEIVLTQNIKTNPRIWRCAGSLEFQPRSGVSARLLTTDPARPARGPLERIIEITSIRSGEIIPPNLYFSLLATDVDGVEWLNPSVEVNERFHDSHAVLDVRCNWIKCQSAAVGKPDSTHILYLDDADFPLNEMTSIETVGAFGKSVRSTRNTSAGSLGDVSVLYVKTLGDAAFYELIAKPKEGWHLREDFDSKLIETVHFITASTMSFAVCESVFAEVAYLELSKATAPPSGIFPRPILSTPHRSADFYRLFHAYMSYALNDKKGDDFSFISSKLYPLYSLANVSLEAVALLISVTVEAITQAQFRKLGSAAGELISEIKIIVKALCSLEVSKDTITRSIGILSGMKSSRAVDKLYSLARDGKIHASEIKVWKDLRNTAAHGSLHAKPTEMQTLLDNVYTAANLLNKLVFLSIGYQGHYTDYSTKGWPYMGFDMQPQVQIEPATETSPSP